MHPRVNAAIRSIGLAAAVAMPLIASGPSQAAEPTSEKGKAASSHVYLEAGDALGLEIYGREQASEPVASASEPVEDKDLVVAGEPAPQTATKPAR